MLDSQERKEYKKKWRRENLIKVRKQCAKSARKCRADNPEKTKQQDRKNRLTRHQQAMNKVQWAVESGRLIRFKHCECCGGERPTQGHHKDYSKPLDVVWLCVSCHAYTHKLLDDMEAYLPTEEDIFMVIAGDNHEDIGNEGYLVICRSKAKAIYKLITGEV